MSRSLFFLALGALASTTPVLGYAQDFNFDPRVNGVKEFPPQFEYEIDTKGMLRVGSLVVPLGKTALALAPSKADENLRLRLRAPAHFLGDKTKLRIENGKGVAFRESTLTTHDVKPMKSKSLVIVSGKHLELTKAELSEGIRVCLLSQGTTTEVPMTEAELCTASYRLADDGSTKPKLEIIPETLEESWSLNGKSATRKGILILNDKDKDINLTSRLPNGMSLRLAGRPVVPDLEDFSLNGKSGCLEIVGKGQPPITDVTISEDRWTYCFPVGEVDNGLALTFHGSGGSSFPIQFQHRFRFSKSPLAPEMRPKLASARLSKTYLSQPEVKVESSEGTLLSGADVSPIEGEKGFYLWTPRDLEPGWNRRSLDVRDQSLPDSNTTTHTASTRFYREYAGEFSAGGGISSASEDSVLVLGRFAGSYWFETLGGWRNKYLSHQRWGASATYTKNLTSVGNFTDLSALEANVKYRGISGLRDQDMTVGLFAGYQGLSFRHEPSQALGGGVFYSGPIWDFVDRVVNWIPYFDNPKYVTLEVATYPASLSDVKVTESLSISLRGKMSFTPRFFIEGGLRQLKFNYSRTTESGTTIKVNATGTSGFGGFGINF